MDTIEHACLVSGPFLHVHLLFGTVVCAISSLPICSFAFTFLTDNSSANRAGGNNSCGPFGGRYNVSNNILDQGLGKNIFFLYYLLFFLNEKKTFFFKPNPDWTASGRLYKNQSRPGPDAGFSGGVVDRPGRRAAQNHFLRKRACLRKIAREHCFHPIWDNKRHTWARNPWFERNKNYITCIFWRVLPTFIN